MKKIVMHGLFIIRVDVKETNSIITITNIKNNDESVMLIREDGTFIQMDNKNPGDKVVSHALKVYKRMVA